MTSVPEKCVSCFHRNWPEGAVGAETTLEVKGTLWERAWGGSERLGFQEWHQSGDRDEEVDRSSLSWAFKPHFGISIDPKGKRKPWKYLKQKTDEVVLAMCGLPQ